MSIKGILISLVAPMSDHIANGGEKILGNASSIKRRPDGRVYISGQMQRHVLFSALDRLNADASDKGDSYVSNGDGITTKVETDLRADLGGFLQTSKESYSGRRTAPLSATPAVALGESEVGRDLVIRLKLNDLPIYKGTNDAWKKMPPEEKLKWSKQEQALATREFSVEDEMLMNFFVDVAAVGVRKRYRYAGDLHLGTEYVKHYGNDEKLRRLKLALEASASMTDYANQARNATSGEPQKALLVFDTKLSRKAARYFKAGETEQSRIIAELQGRGATYFLGDDTDAGALSVFEAYEKARAFLESAELFDPAPDAQILTTEEFEKAVGV